MRVFRDLDLVEQLGSGIPRILEFYSRDCFTFSSNFLRMAFPTAEVTPQDNPSYAPQVSPQVERLIVVLDGAMSRQELQDTLGLKDRKNFINNYIDPALKAGAIEYTIPNKPNSKHQKYRLSDSTPQVTPRVTPQVTPQVERLIVVLDGAMSRQELQGVLDLADRKSFSNNYIKPAMEYGFIEYTIPEKPNSSNQKYRLTETGKTYKKSLMK